MTQTLILFYYTTLLTMAANFTCQIFATGCVTEECTDGTRANPQVLQSGEWCETVLGYSYKAWVR